MACTYYFKNLFCFYKQFICAAGNGEEQLFSFGLLNIKASFCKKISLLIKRSSLKIKPFGLLMPLLPVLPAGTLVLLDFFPMIIFFKCLKMQSFKIENWKIEPQTSNFKFKTSNLKPQTSNNMAGLGDWPLFFYFQNWIAV